MSDCNYNEADKSAAAATTHKEAIARQYISSVLGTNPSPEIFGRWAKKQNIMLHPDVAFLVPVKGMGRGAFARRTLPAGTVIVSCPFTSCISPYLNSTGEHKLQKGHEVHTILENESNIKNDNVLKVVLRLMAELCKCKPRHPSSSFSHHPHVMLKSMSPSLSSTWQPWLEVCPRMPHHLFDLTEEQTEVLVAGKKQQFMWKVQEQHQQQHKEIEQCNLSQESENECINDNNTEQLLSDGGNKFINAQEAISTKESEHNLEDDEMHLEEKLLQQKLSSVPETITISTSWTHLSQQLRELRVRERWQCAQHVIQSYPQHWPSPLANFTMFCECLAQVLSRNFHRDEVAEREGPYLLPGLDILNHSSSKCNVSLEIHGGGRQHQTTFTAITTKPVMRQEQILLSYGGIGSARFATEFQFVTDEVLAEDMIRFSADCMVEMALSYWQHHSDANSREKEKQEHQNKECYVNTENMERELRRRVEYMQRAGVLYDEGFYLHKPKLSSSSLSSPSDCRTDRNAIVTANSVLPLSEQGSNVQAGVRVLQIVVYLLLFCNKAAFNDTYKVMNKSWESPLQCFHCTSSPSSQKYVSDNEKKYKAQMLFFLNAKWAAAHVQDALVDSLFSVDSSHVTLFETEYNAIRLQLIHATLQSEQTILKNYLQLIE